MIGIKMSQLRHYVPGLTKKHSEKGMLSTHSEALLQMTELHSNDPL